MIEIDGAFYPFDNKIVRRNLGKPHKVYPPVRKFIRNFRVAIDGGAYVGRWSQMLSEEFEKVYAFELCPGNYECLIRNAPDVKAFNMALGKIEGKCSFTPDKDKDSPVYNVKKGNDIRVTTIDSLNLGVCDFIKLDLQGYDYFALLGARKTIETCRPIVMFEHETKCFKRYGVKPYEPEKFLKSLGYRQLIKTKEPVYGPD